jgi:hypothetical protein
MNRMRPLQNRVERPKVGRSPSWHALLLAMALALGAPATLRAQSETARLDGLNVIETPGHPFGSRSAQLALAKARELGARAIAVIPFLWQSSLSSPDLARGKDMDDAQLRAAIHDAHMLGLAVVVKPHVWVPQSWAGAVVMRSEETWKAWFANYRRELARIARIAENEGAEALAIGTELQATTMRPEWLEVVGETRSAYSGRLLYVAHNIEEAEAVPFWDRLDAVGVSLYPPLGADDDRDYRHGVMRAIADRLEALAARTEKSIVVGEIGLRSARGAAAKPWESAEERETDPDPSLQAAVLADWLAILDRPAVSGILIWRWFTDPDAGGMTDTDFTVQGKPAERVLSCAWTRVCEQAKAGLRSP